MAVKHNIGLSQARTLMFDRLRVLTSVTCPVEEAGGLVLAEDCLARVDCPVAPTSLKDGFAVCASDLAGVTEADPIRLQLLGTMAAGDPTDLVVTSGKTVWVMTGARVPAGADAVLPQEFTRVEAAWVHCLRDAEPGRNILAQGYDVARQRPIGRAGQCLTPARTGLLAAGGFAQVKVIPRPRVGLLGIGDELVCPGQVLGKGQLYASNLVTLKSWLHRFGMPAEMRIVPDIQGRICQAVTSWAEVKDVILTSGGAWMSDRDLTVRSLQALGGEVVFHRIRMGPGKAIAMVQLDDTVVFCLPGGPPSNEMAFLQVALPGLLYLAGQRPEPFRRRRACLAETISGQADWSQFLQAQVVETQGQEVVKPLKRGSRLQCQADANALIEIPEGTAHIQANEQISVQCLREPAV